MKNEELLRQLTEAFLMEASEQLSVLQSLIETCVDLNLEPAEKQSAVETLHRQVHNLKGSARSTNYTAIESLCNPVEGVLADIRRGTRELDSASLDLLRRATGEIEILLKSNRDTELNAAQLQIIDSCQKMMNSAEGGGAVIAPPKAATADSAIETIKSVAIVPQIPEQDNGKLTGKGKDKEKGREKEKEKEKENEEQKEEQQTVSLVTPQEVPVAETLSLSASVSHEAPELATPRVIRAETDRDTYSINASRLDRLTTNADELITVKTMARQHAVDTREIMELISNWSQQWSRLAPELKAAREMMERDQIQMNYSHRQRSSVTRLKEGLEENSNFLSVLQAKVSSLLKNSEDFSLSTSASVDTLLDETKHLLMVPCANILESITDEVQKIADFLNRNISFSLRGTNVEIDKRILTELHDALVMLLRELIQDVIEPAQQRQILSKPKTGRIRISVNSSEKGFVDLEISHDGQSLMMNQLCQDLVSSGLITKTEAATCSTDELLRKALRNEISVPGLPLNSLTKLLNDLRNIGGKTQCTTDEEGRLQLRIQVPSTMGTFRGVLVDVANKMFVIPTTSVDRVVRIKKEDMRPIEGTDTILLGDALIPVCRLDEVLDIPSRYEGIEKEHLTVGVLGSGEERIGFVVNEVLDEQEILVKSLGQVLNGTRNVSAVTILGSGKVVPVLNVSDLLKESRGNRPVHKSSRATATAVRNGSSAQQSSRSTAVPVKQNPPSKSSAAKKVLIVDDTLTARILLRNILESAGLTIKTANDGAEALKFLKSEAFDLLITDIEMPVMNGFELTQQVRQDPSLSDLPVIMVTSLTSRGDRERGVEVGANAYFVKSSFDQANLLNVISSLIQIQ